MTARQHEIANTKIRIQETGRNLLISSGRFDIEIQAADVQEFIDALVTFKAPTDQAARIRELETKLEEVTATAEAFQETIAEFQDASGLCAPAEERGGDPSGVRPKHLRRHIEELSSALQAAGEALENAKRWMRRPDYESGYTRQYDEEMAAIDAAIKAARGEG